MRVLNEVINSYGVQVDFVRSVMAGDHLREEEHMLLETMLANVPQSRTVKSNSLELTPSNTPQLSPATTPANKKNRNIGTYLPTSSAVVTVDLQPLAF